MRKRLSISQKVDKFRQLRYFVLSCGDIRNLHARGAESKKERNNHGRSKEDKNKKDSSKRDST